MSAEGLALDLGAGNGDSLDPCPHSPFLPGDICQLTLAPLPPTRY